MIVEKSNFCVYCIWRVVCKVVGLDTKFGATLLCSTNIIDIKVTIALKRVFSNRNKALLIATTLFSSVDCFLIPVNHSANCSEVNNVGCKSCDFYGLFASAVEIASSAPGRLSARWQSK